MLYVSFESASLPMAISLKEIYRECQNLKVLKYSSIFKKEKPMYSNILNYMHSDTITC